MRTRIIDYLIKLGLKSGIFLRENKDQLPYKIRIIDRLPYKIRIKDLESFCVRTRIIDYPYKIRIKNLESLS